MHWTCDFQIELGKYFDRLTSFIHNLFQKWQIDSKELVNEPPHLNEKHGHDADWKAFLPKKRLSPNLSQVGTVVGFD